MNTPAENVTDNIPENVLIRLYRRFVYGTSRLQPVVLLLLRLYGCQFVIDGWGKLNNHAKVASFFSDLGIPLPGVNAWFVGGLEWVGGMLLVVGLFSRPIALLLTGNFIVAYLSVPDDRTKFLHLFTDPDSFIGASPFFYLLVSVVVLAFGPGLLSLDALADWLLGRRKGVRGFEPALAGGAVMPAAGR